MPCFALMGFATWGSQVNSVLREWRVKFFPLYFHSELVSYHWLFYSVGLWRAVHWLFEVASKRKWGRKSIIDFAFCLTRTLRTEKHIRSQVLAVGQLRLLCVSRRETEGKNRKEAEGEKEHQTTVIHLSLESHAQSSCFHHFSSPLRS